MNEKNLNRAGGTSSVILVSLLLFYLPSVLAIFNHTHEHPGWIVMNVIMSTFYTAVFCVNYYWLVPAMLIRSDRKPLYFAANLCMIIAICALIQLWFEAHGGIPGPRHRLPRELTIGQYLMSWLRFLIRDGIMMVLSAALAFALRLSLERENVRRRELELNAEQRQMEIKTLKAQLNPHFLFNSLNSIYALIAFAPDKAQQALHDLSNMLRFMIYDSAAPSVPLTKELRFIKEYIELMKLRHSSETRITYDEHVPGDSGMTVAPMLFLTLVENAFKHSGHNGNAWFISISFRLEDSVLTGIVVNTYPEKESSGLPSGDTGVGLSNIRRQLCLLYPGRHSISTEKKDGVFRAEIKIRIT